MGDGGLTEAGVLEDALSIPGHPRLSAIAIYRPSASVDLSFHSLPAEVQASHFARSKGLKKEGLETGFPEESRGSGPIVRNL